MNFPKKVLVSILVLINFMLLHYVVSSLPIRFDLTSDSVFTLSDSSITLVEKIEDPITIDLYTSRSLEEIPAGFKNFAIRVEKLLKQYESAAKGKIRLNIINPKPDTPEEAMAIAAGLESPEVQSGDKVFLGIVATQGDAEHVIPFFEPRKEEFLEYDISKIIYQAQQFTKSKIGLISTLPLQSAGMPSMPGQPQQPDQFFIEQLGANFEIEAIEPTASRIPADIDLLAIIHPKNLNDSLLYQIDQFALAGKPVFLALDPSSTVDREQSRQMQMMGGGMQGQQTSSDLPKLAAAWGIEYDSGKIVLDPDNSVAQGNYVNTSWLILEGDRLNRSLLPTASLDSAVVIPEAGALSHAEGATTKWTSIISTGSDTSAVPGMMMQFTQPNQLMSRAEALGKQVDIAALIGGEANTAFPNGDPQGSENSTVEHRSNGNINVFVISDTDWLFDQYSIQRSNFFGMQSIQKLNENATLSANMMEFIGGSRDLIGIRSKGSTPRQFDVVKAMEAEAQKTYQAKLESVEAELAKISAKIQELIKDQQGSGFIQATPEIQAVLQENREQEAKLKDERRNVRRELRQGIESLGTKIAVINVLWAPFGLALFGLAYHRLRKQQ